MNTKKEEKERKDLLQIIQVMNLMDDDFFHKVAEDLRACEEILQVIMEDEGLRLKYVEPQKFLRNCGTRSVRLDVLCTAVDGRRFGIEVQKKNVDDHQRRVRYEGANIDTVLTEQGIDFKNIPDVCMVYIARFDIFHQGRVVYHIGRIVEENGARVYNGFREIYVNTKANDGSKISELTRYMTRTRGVCLGFPMLSKRVKYLKEENEGVEEMCDALEKYAEKYAKKYAERARLEAKKKTAQKAKRKAKKDLERNVRNLFNNGASLELVMASIKGLSVVRIQEIYESVNEAHAG